MNENKTTREVMEAQLALLLAVSEEMKESESNYRERNTASGITMITPRGHDRKRLIELTDAMLRVSNYLDRWESTKD